ncbi:MAG: DUF1730 domain-containing protein [Oscillospiraceae bacterium]|nr:DUF1730 domain-containing protein [Oscillospiraceae bacterium]
MAKCLPDYGVCGFAELAPHLLPCRAAERLPAGAKSILTAVFPYLLPEKYYAGRNVARFAVVPDYHRVVLARLERACGVLRSAYPAEAFVPFTDNSPVPEKPAALLCGLGVIGRNALFIHPRWGSWVFLGCIVSTAPLDELKNTHNAAHECALRCSGDCNACVAACPAGAIADGRVDRRICLSFLSQRRNANRAELAKTSGVLWGCDICQEVCPMNKGVPAEPPAEFIAGAVPVFSAQAEQRVWEFGLQR